MSQIKVAPGGLLGFVIGILSGAKNLFAFLYIDSQNLRSAQNDNLATSSIVLEAGIQVWFRQPG